ncbi:hypothetical protein PIB30_063923 [Stylosanthes scabra]|uniref:Uncharacterized protein n=1 Tax=Stylosanthes scabra TaxID=79078 RepID=A0ABU6WJX4_9FABA|nr:hypothetical protein [Stylosanthes scabra]
MEPAFRAFCFFAVTIGKNPGAFTAQIEAIQDEKECVEEMQALLGDPRRRLRCRRLMFPPPMEELLLSREVL